MKWQPAKPPRGGASYPISWRSYARARLLQSAAAHWRDFIPLVRGHAQRRARQL